MYIGYTEEQEALRHELRAYYDEAAHARDRGAARRRPRRRPGPCAQVVQQMGADGWLGIGWPKEYGGQGRSAIEQFIFFDESMRAGAPVPMLTINTVGPDDHALRHRRAEGSSSCRRSCRARSTSASATPSPAPAPTSRRCKTRAVRDGDEYVINGQKIFTSLASDADYFWLAVRTNPEVKKHKGISMIIVPMDTPGHQGRADAPARRARHQPRSTTTCACRRQPRRRREQRLGAHHQPAQPRAGHAVLVGDDRARVYAEVRRWAQETKLADGRRVIDQEWVQVNLARVHAKLEFLRLINWKVAWAATQGRLDVADASTIKVFGTEFYLEAFRLLMEILGPVAAT